MAFNVPYLGHGIGLRAEHFSHFLEDDNAPAIDWLEAISENFMLDGGRPMAVLDRVCERAPVVLHGVSLSIGAVAPLNRDYIARLKKLIARVNPPWVSDHVCWGSHGVHYAHDLLPLPYTEEALAHVIAKVSQVQEALDRQILLENVSSYISFNASTMTEWEFLTAVAQGADCGLLLDVNNIYVSSRNHGFDPDEFINGIPKDRVGQIHVAGHDDHGAYVLDTHDHPVPEAVWALYGKAVQRFGRVSTLVEWDDLIPPLDVLLAECERARAIEAEILAATATVPVKAVSASRRGAA